MRFKVKEIIAWALIMLTVGFVAGALIAKGPGVWRDAPRPLQSSMQRPQSVIDGIAGCLVPEVPLAPECLEGGAPRCPHEDGDPSGWPCLWVEPGTQLVYYVDSSSYWD